MFVSLVLGMLYRFLCGLHLFRFAFYGILFHDVLLGSSLHDLIVLLYICPRNTIVYGILFCEIRTCYILPDSFIRCGTLLCEGRGSTDSIQCDGL
jgi:hypothetical protein